MDMRVLFSCGEDRHTASASSALSSTVAPLRHRGEGKGLAGGAPPPPTVDPPLGTQLCDALFNVSSATTSLSPSAWSSTPSDDAHLHRTKEEEKEEEESSIIKGDTPVRYVFSSVDWLCMTAFLRFFPDRIDAFPYRLEALVYQTAFTWERFYRAYYGSSWFPLVGSDPVSSGSLMHPSTAANTAAALAEALRCWNHFIGYVWTSFDGKPDDLALLHPPPSAEGTTTTTSSASSSTGRVSVSSKCVVVTCVFLPIWRCLLRLYQRHGQGEQWCVFDRHPHGDAIQRRSAAFCTGGEEGMGEEKEVVEDRPHAPPFVSRTPPLYLPPIPVIRMALRAAANLSDECVVAMGDTACEMEEEEDTTTSESHTAPPPPPPPFPSPAAAFSDSAAAIVSRFRTAMPFDNSAAPEEAGWKDVMVSFVQHCVASDPRTEVRAEALQTIGVWCWAYPSLDAMLLHRGLYRVTVEVLRADADPHCRSKAAWALSNLCARLADSSDRASSSPPPPPSSSFSLRHQPELMQWVCEAALCATSWRVQQEAEYAHPMPGYARHTTRSSSTTTASSTSAASVMVESVLHHGVRMMRALLQLLSVEECWQCAPKCPMDRRDRLGNEGDPKGFGGDEVPPNRRLTRQKDGRNHPHWVDDEEEEEVVIEAFLTRLTRFLSSPRNVKLRWNAAMALGVAVSRKDIFEAEPSGTSSAILLLCDVLQRDTFFKVRIRVVEALGGVCLEGLQGEYSAHGDYTPIVIQAMCEALEKCQSTPFPAGPHGDETIHPNAFQDGTQRSGGEKGVATSQRDSGAMEVGMASPPIRPSFGTLETGTSAPGTRPSFASSSTSFSSPSGIEQGRQELHRVTVATIAKILRTAKPSAALDSVLKKYAGVLKREELA